MRKRTVNCCRCDYNICSGEKYYVILGEIYCDEHGEEWIKDEIEENFDRYKDDLAELVGAIVVEE